MIVVTVEPFTGI